MHLNITTLLTKSYKLDVSKDDAIDYIVRNNLYSSIYKHDLFEIDAYLNKMDILKFVGTHQLKDTKEANFVMFSFDISKFRINHYKKVISEKIIELSAKLQKVINYDCFIDLFNNSKELNKVKQYLDSLVFKKDDFNVQSGESERIKKIHFDYCNNAKKIIQRKERFPNEYKDITKLLTKINDYIRIYKQINNLFRYKENNENIRGVYVIVCDGILNISICLEKKFKSLFNFNHNKASTLLDLRKDSAKLSSTIDTSTSLFDFITENNSLFKIDALITDSFVQKEVSKISFIKSVFDESEINQCVTSKNQSLANTFRVYYNSLVLFTNQNFSKSIDEIYECVVDNLVDGNLQMNFVLRQGYRTQLLNLKNYEKSNSLVNIFKDRERYILSVAEPLNFCGECANSKENIDVESNHTYKYYAYYSYLALSSAVIFSSISKFKFYCLENSLSNVGHIVNKSTRYKTIIEQLELSNNALTTFSFSTFSMNENFRHISEFVGKESGCYETERNLKIRSESLWTEVNTISAYIYPLVQITLSIASIICSVIVAISAFSLKDLWVECFFKKNPNALLTAEIIDIVLIVLVLIFIFIAILFGIVAAKKFTSLNKKKRR